MGDCCKRDIADQREEKKITNLATTSEYLSGKVSTLERLADSSRFLFQQEEEIITK